MKWNDSVIHKVEFQEEFIPWCERAVSEVQGVYNDTPEF
jgi:hypothetical protein